jgi:hypothetical protein
MEQSKKKAIMVAVIVVCLALAGAIAYMNRPGASSSSTGAMKRGTMMWVKCANPDCGAEYQMDMKDYYEYLEKHLKGDAVTQPPCEKCKEQSIYRAVKCEKCGTVFFYGRSVGDYVDRCPKCNYSKIEEERKKARGGG